MQIPVEVDTVSTFVNQPSFSIPALSKALSITHVRTQIMVYIKNSDL